MAWALAQRDQDALTKLAAASVGDALPVPVALNKVPLESLCVLPIPLSILTPKPCGGSANLPWWVEGGARMEAYDGIEPEQRASEEKPKRPGPREFLARQDAQGTWLRYSPRMTVHMRNSPPNAHKIQPEQQDLFSVEEIAEDTRFIADLSFPDEQTARGFAERFAPILTGGEWLAVGREGRPVEVAAVAVPAPKPLTRVGDEWTLTLTSDLVARGENLGFLTDLDVSALIHLSGKATTDFPDSKQWQMRGFAETEGLHGFNAASGLRRLPALAIRRGSCWRITGSGSHALAVALSARAGLGERTDEGCGRFALDLQPVKALASPDCHKTSPPRNRAEEMLLAVKRIASEKHGNLPSLSQLQWLRGSALAALDEVQMQTLFEKIETIPVRRPKGGSAWKNFPLSALRREMERFPDLEEKRLLVSQLVQWLGLQARSKAEEPRP
jgi:hypothetical protein